MHFAGRRKRHEFGQVGAVRNLGDAQQIHDQVADVGASMLGQRIGKAIELAVMDEMRKLVAESQEGIRRSDEVHEIGQGVL